MRVDPEARRPPTSLKEKRNDIEKLIKLQRPRTSPRLFVGLRA